MAHDLAHMARNYRNHGWPLEPPANRQWKTQSSPPLCFKEINCANSLSEPKNISSLGQVSRCKCICENLGRGLMKPGPDFEIINSVLFWATMFVVVQFPALETPTIFMWMFQVCSWSWSLSLKHLHFSKLSFKVQFVKVGATITAKIYSGRRHQRMWNLGWW